MPAWRVAPRGAATSSEEVRLELLRLRSATNAYQAIQDDSMMFLELHAATKKPADPTADDWPAILRRRVKASLLDSEMPGAVAGIADALAVLLAGVDHQEV